MIKAWRTLLYLKYGIKMAFLVDAEKTTIQSSVGRGRSEE
jgi:hypothetical protein